jgi:hypothetical protein
MGISVGALSSRPPSLRPESYLPNKIRMGQIYGPFAKAMSRRGISPNELDINPFAAATGCIYLQADNDGNLCISDNSRTLIVGVDSSTITILRASAKQIQFLEKTYPRLCFEKGDDGPLGDSDWTVKFPETEDHKAIGRELVDFVQAKMKEKHITSPHTRPFAVSTSCSFLDQATPSSCLCDGLLHSTDIGVLMRYGSDKGLQIFQATHSQILELQRAFPSLTFVPGQPQDGRMLWEVKGLQSVPVKQIEKTGREISSFIDRRTKECEEA